MKKLLSFLPAPHAPACNLLLDQRIELGRCPGARLLLDVTEQRPEHGRGAHLPPQRVRCLPTEPLKESVRSRCEIERVGPQRFCGERLCPACYHAEVLSHCARMG